MANGGRHTEGADGVFGVFIDNCAVHGFVDNGDLVELGNQEQKGIKGGAQVAVFGGPDRVRGYSLNVFLELGVAGCLAVACHVLAEAVGIF